MFFAVVISILPRLVVRLPAPNSTPPSKYLIPLLCPRPHRVGALCVGGRSLSVRLSVFLVPDTKSRMKGLSKLKIYRKEAYELQAWYTDGVR